MLSKSAKYCLKVITYLAKNKDDGKKYPLALLAEELEIPQFFLGKLLQQLSKRELIAAQKGPNGGFFLTTDQLQKSPIEYIRAIEGEQFMNWCMLDQAPCNRDHPCEYHHIYSKLTSGFIRELSELQLADIE